MLKFSIGIMYSIFFAVLNSIMFYGLIIKNKDSQDVKSHTPIKNSLSFIVSTIALTISLYVTEFKLNPDGYWSSLWSYIIICIIGKITVLFINKILNWIYMDVADYTKDIKVTVFFSCLFLALMSYCVGAFFWAASYVTVAIGKFLWLDFDPKTIKKDINTFFEGYSWTKSYGMFQGVIMLIALFVEMKLNISEIYFGIGMSLTALYVVYKTKQIAVNGDKVY